MAEIDVRKAELTALKLLKANEHLEAGHAAVFKSFGLSAPQYNVLRILRGAGDQHLCCNEVGARMIKRVPDVTRLLDRLEQRELIERWRCDSDRRVVRARITGRRAGPADVHRRASAGSHPPGVRLLRRRRAGAAGHAAGRPPGRLSFLDKCLLQQGCTGRKDDTMRPHRSLEPGLRLSRLLAGVLVADHGQGRSMT